MSTIYSAGNKTTAIAGIKSALNGFIVNLPDGTKDLNREAMTAWLQAEFNDMLADGEATVQSYIAQIITSRVPALVQSLNTKVRKEVFMSRPDWPGTTNYSVSVPTAIREGLAELQRLSAALGQHYAGTPDKIANVLFSYIEENIEGDISPGVQRLILSGALLETYVTDRGEESAPSPVSALFDRDQNDGITVAVSAVPSGRNISKRRFYMANSASNTASYQLIPNPADDMGWPAATMSFTFDADTLRAENLQEPCPSMTWEEPPADARWVCSIGNGIHLVASGNTVYPCEAFHPYAYPREYTKTTSHPITGMVGMDGVAVIGTRGPLKLLQGTDSASLTEIKHNSGQSVVSARSMVAMSQGVVIFASPDGLCAVDGLGQVKNITGPEGFDLFDREGWQALDPEGIFAAEWEGCYVFHVPAGYCYSLDVRTGRLLKIEATGSAFYLDQLTDTLYLASGPAILAVGEGTGRRTGTWKSKLVQLPSYTGMAWAQVRGDFTADATVKVYRDGALHHTTTASNDTPLRLPAGRASEWEVELSSASDVQEVTIASSTGELKAV